jgi:hypothetical protein
VKSGKTALCLDLKETCKKTGDRRWHTYVSVYFMMDNHSHKFERATVDLVNQAGMVGGVF